MIVEKKGYSYNDLTIIPEVISNVSSRSECNCREDNDFLPIFTAPMASVVNEKNIDIFYENGINAIIPRLRSKLPIPEPEPDIDTRRIPTITRIQENDDARLTNGTMALLNVNGK